MTSRDAPRVPEGIAPADRGLYEALGDALPRFATVPTPGARHDLERVVLTANALGTPLMPWQQLVARVTTERRLDNPDEYRYKIIVLSVPRQSGKTTLMRTVLTQRALMNTGRRAFYTAQTGKDAAARWMDLVAAVDNGPLRGHVRKRLAIGSQSLVFPNGSTIAPFAPTPKSLHGYTPHDVMCDEVFAFDAAQGNDLMGAIGPAQITISSRQLWLVSTMGTRDSTFLHEWVELGRLAVDDPAAAIAYFEWSMTPGLDPYDPMSWTFHPALGHTIAVDDLADASAHHSPGEWLRAFMNTRSVTSEAVIDAATVAATATDQTPPAATSDIAIAFEVSRDRSRAAIWAAWHDPTTGRPAVRLVQAGAGAEWVAPAIAELRETWRPRAIGADRGGAPTRDVLDTLETTYPNIDVVAMQSNDFATACDAFRARMNERTMSHDGTPALADAIESAVTKTLGQGWTWDRVKSRGPIPDLIAATVALRLIERSPAPPPQPKVWSPS
jgi:phage terminase large subunit-like protein